MRDMFKNLNPDDTMLVESIDVECYFMMDLRDKDETERARSIKSITKDTVVEAWGVPMYMWLDRPHVSYWVNHSIYELQPKRLSICIGYDNAHPDCYGTVQAGEYHVTRLNCKAGIVIEDHDDMVRYFFSDYEGTRRLHSQLNRLNCNR